MSKNFFINNREKLFSKIENNSIVVLFAGQSPFKRGDELYPFSPDRNFYYLTGINKEHLILLLIKTNEITQATLYIERHDEVQAKWVGASINQKEALSLSGITNIKYLDQFHWDLSSTVFKMSISNLYLDLENRNWNNQNSPSLSFCRTFKEKYPSIEVYNIYDIFSSLREIKDSYEIDLIKKAVNITKLGIEEMMLNARPQMFEYEIEAYFDFVLKKNGVREKAFETIAASGKNATILHYTSNLSQTSDGDLILFDVGAQVECYNGDLSRTFPLNGKFSALQKQIYNIVLSGQQKVIDAIKPNTPFSSLNEILIEHYYNELKKIGLVQTKEDVSNYYYHNVSHYLGALTHDVGKYKETLLKAGMVLTVEPGLYIEQYNIGIRIEDDVLVTENGCEILSCQLVKTVEEIEEFMKNGANNER